MLLVHCDSSVVFALHCRPTDAETNSQTDRHCASSRDVHRHIQTVWDRWTDSHS